MKHLFTLLALLIVPSAFAVSSVIQADIDSHTYLPGGTINVSGIVYSGTSPATAGTSVTLNITGGNSTTTTTGSGGRFSKTMTAPTDLGVHTLTVSASGASTILTFTVSNIADVILDIVNETIVVALDEYPYGGISGADSRIDTSDVNSGNFTIPGVGDYYVIVEKDSTTGKYKTAYIDDDSNLSFSNSDDPGGMPLHKYLEEGDKIKLGSKQFTIVYIDPAGSEMVLAERIKPVFEGGEVHKLLAIALDSSGSPASGVALDFKEFADNGTQIGSTATLGNTTANGTILSPLTIRSDLGRVHLVVNDMGHISYILETFILRVDLKTPEGVPVYVIAPGGTMIFTGSVLNASTNQPIKQTFILNVTISAPDGASTEQLTMINGTHNETLEAPSLEGGYVADFAVEYNGIIKKARLTFDVREPSGFKLSMFPLAKGKGETEGFAPDEPGALLIGATRASNGELMSLSNSTDNCGNVSLESVLDSKGINWFTGDMQRLNGSNQSEVETQLMSIVNMGNAPFTNITHFFDTLAYDAPDFIKNDIKKDFGEGCVILFTAPNETGVYDVKVGASIGNKTEYVRFPIGVQEVFVHAYPISSETGNFQWAVSPGGSVNLAIEAYDPVSGSQIAPGNILDAQLIEVFAEQEDAVVTDQMVNEGFYPDVTFGGSGGSRHAILNFTTNDSVMGDHFVKFKVKVNVTRKNATGDYVNKTVMAIGHGWFQEKMYSVYVHPYGDSRGSFGSSSPVNLTVEVRDAAGSTGIAGVTAILTAVRYMETGEDVENIYETAGSTTVPRCTTSEASTSGNASAGTLTSTRAGTCTLTFVAPNTWNNTWETGGYDVVVTVNKTTDTGETITDYGRGRFEVRNFFFWAWTQNWEAAGNQPIEILLETMGPDWQGINASVTMEKLIYYGAWDNWRPPTIINSSLGITESTTDGQGSITLPGGQATNEGQYSVLLRATATVDGQSLSQTTEAWFYVRPFAIYVDDKKAFLSEFDNWDRRYAIGDTIDLTIKGFESIDRSTRIPSGSGHNLSDSWIKSVEKMGMWGIDFKRKEDLLTGNNMTWNCMGSECNLSFNLSGFPQGEYNLKVVANDTDGTRVDGWFWFRVERVSVTVPELMDWIQVKEKYKLNNATYFTVDDSCGGDSDTPIEPVNASSNCKYKAVKILERTQPAGDMRYNLTYFLFDKDNNTLYVNASGPQEGHEIPENVDYNAGAFQVVTVNGTFTDTMGTNWTVTDMDNTSNTVYVEATDGVIGYNPWSWDDMNNKYTDTFPIEINTSLSKSGDFLMGDELWDMDWAEIDLDGDGNYWCDDINSGCDSYILIMADSVNAGIYNLVLVGNSTNMSRAKNSSDPNGIEFGGDPIYLVNKKYNAGSSGDTNSYKLTFTTNRPGWPGKDLGIFRPGSNVTVPIMVTQPSNRSAKISNATVTVTAAVQFGMMGEQEFPVIATPVNTSASGLALVKVNTTDLPNGDYFLKIQVTPEGEPPVIVDNIWDNPRVSIRSFVVRGEIGMRGRITGFEMWKPQVRYSDEVMGGFTEFMSCYTCDNPNNTIYRMDSWPYDQYVFYNWTSGLVGVDDGDGDFNGGAAYYNISTEFVQIKKHNGNTEFMRATVTLEDDWYTTTVVNGTSVSDRYYNFTVQDINAGTVLITVQKIDPWGTWDVTNNQWVDNGSAIPGGGPEGDSGFNITDINAGTNRVNITWVYPTITLNSTLDIEGREKMARVLDTNNGYELIIYNSPARNTSEDLEGQWNDLPDTVRVIDNETGQMVGSKEYRIGEAIPEMDNWSVVKAHKWDERVYLSNFAMGGRIVYPVPRLADKNRVMYVANFTEQSAGMKVKWGGGGGPEEGKELGNDTYYMLLFDNKENGKDKVSHAMVDDDPVFDDRWVPSEYGDWMPYDYDHVEEGRMDWQYNYSENRKEIGRENWPFSVTGFNESAKKANLFAFKDWAMKGENLTLWVTAKEFTGEKIVGNISTVSVEGVTFGCYGPEPLPPDTITTLMSTPSADLSNKGVAYLTLDLSNATMGDYDIKFKVEASDGRVEYLKKHFWVEDPAGWIEIEAECEGFIDDGGEEPSSGGSEGS